MTTKLLHCYVTKNLRPATRFVALFWLLAQTETWLFALLFAINVNSNMSLMYISVVTPLKCCLFCKCSMYSCAASKPCCLKSSSAEVCRKRHDVHCPNCGKTTAQVPHLLNMLHAEEASMHVDNPTSVSFFIPNRHLSLLATFTYSLRTCRKRRPVRQTRPLTKPPGRHCPIRYVTRMPKRHW